jgi:hypothetical protein
VKTTNSEFWKEFVVSETIKAAQITTKSRFRAVFVAFLTTKTGDFSVFVVKRQFS